MSISDRYLKSYQFKLDVISVIPIVMIIHTYEWPNTVLSDELNLVNALWLLKLIRISNTGYALRPGFSKRIIK